MEKNKNIRFGDFVREELKNPDSLISKHTHRLLYWKRLVKSSPKKYKIICEFGKFNFYEKGNLIENGCCLDVGDIIKLKS